MARLYEDSDEDFPTVSVMIKQSNGNKPSTSSHTSSKGKAKAMDSHSSKNEENLKLRTAIGSNATNSPARGFQLESNSAREASKETPKCRQRLLIASHDNSLLLPLPAKALGSSRMKPVKPTPTQTARAGIENVDLVLMRQSVETFSQQLKGNTAEFDQIRDQDLELKPPALGDTMISRNGRDKNKGSSRVYEGVLCSARENVSPWKSEVSYAIDLRSPKTAPHALGHPEKWQWLPADLSTKESAADLKYEDTSYEEDPLALLKFSPPRSTRVRKVGRIVCPSSSPSQQHSRMSSPIKASRLPPPPHRPSSDLFWDQEFNDGWTDRHAPIKVTPLLQYAPSLTLSDEEQIQPKGGSKTSPRKKARGNAEVKKDFNKIKHDLAREFLKELDDKVTGGQIASETMSAGGIQIIWSKKLNTTAGRASWRKERVNRLGDNTAQTGIYRHIASIELSEKVIDDEGRLLNTLSHEYCHLANFIISGVKDRPHGREFQEWAKKCTQAFGHRGVEVTTKHSYAIDFKYIWECTKCGTQFKRHSKSVDPRRHTCGSCKSKLIQIQPVPRAAAPSEYQLFVKEHFKEAKSAHPSSSQKEIMSLLGVAYKLRKEKAAMLTAAEFLRSGDEEEMHVSNELESAVNILDNLDIRSP